MTNLRGYFTDEEWAAVSKRDYKPQTFTMLLVGLTPENREELRAVVELVAPPFYDFDEISPTPSVDAAKEIAIRLIDKIKNKYGIS